MIFAICRAAQSFAASADRSEWTVVPRSGLSGVAFVPSYIFTTQRSSFGQIATMNGGRTAMKPSTIVGCAPPITDLGPRDSALLPRLTFLDSTDHQPSGATGSSFLPSRASPDFTDQQPSGAAGSALLPQRLTYPASTDQQPSGATGSALLRQRVTFSGSTPRETSAYAPGCTASRI